jgi:hypothetical protein
VPGEHVAIVHRTLWIFRGKESSSRTIPDEQFLVFLQEYGRLRRERNDSDRLSVLGFVHTEAVNSPYDVADSPPRCSGGVPYRPSSAGGIARTFSRAECHVFPLLHRGWVCTTSDCQNVLLTRSHLRPRYRRFRRKVRARCEGRASRGQAEVTVPFFEIARSGEAVGDPGELWFQKVKYDWLRRPAVATAIYLGNIVRGVLAPVLAKRSKSFSLVYAISVGVDRIQRNLRAQVQRSNSGVNRN